MSRYPLDISEENRLWLDAVREEWFRRFKPFDMEDGWSDQVVKRGRTFHPIPAFRADQLKNARLVPSREEMLSLLPSGGIVGEVGTQHGYFARLIDTICRPKTLHLFDLDFRSYHQAALIPPRDDVILHEGDAAGHLANMPDKHFDWLYIDADHSHAGVSRDIREALRVVKEDGLIVFNDYIYWSTLELIEYGVAHAVTETCLRENYEVILFAFEPWMYCDIAIRKM